MSESGTDEVHPSAAAEGKSGFLAFWTTLPGILTGAAALLTAIVGLLAALNLPHPAPVATSPPASSVVQALAPLAASASLGASAETVIRTGAVTMSSPDGVDLSTGQITSSVVDADLYLSCGGTQCSLEWRLVQAPSASSKAACVDALRQRMQDTIQVTSLQPGAELCVQTHDLRVAALKLTQIPGPGAPQLVFEYTLWS